MTLLVTTMTKRAQISIPSAIREGYNMQPGDKLAWIDDGESIKVVPLPRDPLRALRGCARGESLTDRLLAARQEERARERDKR